MDENNLVPLRASSSEAINIFDEVINKARAEARYVVTLDRDEQKYQLKVLTFPKLLESKFPSRPTIYKMIPNGSEWQNFEGWRSYFSIPFDATDESGITEWILFGCEEVVQPQIDAKRGPSPVLRAYCIQRSKTGINLIRDVLVELREKLEKTNNSKEFDLYDDDAILSNRGIIRALSKNVYEHIPVERYILKRAIKSYEQNKPILFRTLLLSENQKPSDDDRPYLIAVRENSKIKIDTKFSERLANTGRKIVKMIDDMMKDD